MFDIDGLNVGEVKNALASVDNSEAIAFIRQYSKNNKTKFTIGFKNHEPVHVMNEEK